MCSLCWIRESPSPTAQLKGRNNDYSRNESCIRGLLNEAHHQLDGIDGQRHQNQQQLFIISSFPFSIFQQAEVMQHQRSVLPGEIQEITGHCKSKNHRSRRKHW
jgi:hypothetical protein